eukprot:9124828-Pyramimonas_sp.AAC.1
MDRARSCCLSAGFDAVDRNESQAIAGLRGPNPTCHQGGSSRRRVTRLGRFRQAQARAGFPRASGRRGGRSVRRASTSRGLGSAIGGR